MCFVLTLFQVHPVYPLVVAANRDEARSRPSRTPHRWPGTPAIMAGQDEVGGGTWLGVNEAGLLAAITNRVGGGPNDPALPSRGQLCLAALRQPDLSMAKATIQADLAVRGYNPFNLLCATVATAWVTTWQGRGQTLKPGVHIITNHGETDDSTDPAIPRAFEMLAGLQLPELDLDRLFEALAEICRDTRQPNPICRPGGERGTVSSSLIALDQHGRIAAYRHADGPPTDHAYEPVKLT